MTAPSMSAELVRCRNCGRRNRVPASAAGVPRCGNCHQPLPWIRHGRAAADPAIRLARLEFGPEPVEMADQLTPRRPPDTRSTTCTASTRGTPTSPAWLPVRPPRPMWLSGWRSTTGAGPTSRSSCGPARRCRAGSPRCGCSCVARPGWPSSPSRPGRNPTDRSADRPGPRPAAATVRAGRTVLARGPPGHVLRPRAGRTAGALRAPAARRDRRRPSAVRQAGQR
jgi:hypothetical protein